MAEPKVLEWVKDDKLVRHLHRMGIKPERAKVPISEIDLKLSQDKQVRLGKKIEQDWVIQYAEAMEKQGGGFPMTLLNRMKSGPKPYFIWSGNHRIAAADLLGVGAVDAYVVEITDPTLQDVIPRAVNAWEAQGVAKKEEKLVYARHMMKQHSMSAEDVAKILGLKADWVLVYVRQQNLAEKITALGVSPNGFASSTLTKLHPLAGNTNVLQKACNIIHKEKIRGAELDQMLADVKAQSTEMGQTSELARWEEIFRQRKKIEKAHSSKASPFTAHKRNALLPLLQRLEKLVRGCDTRNKLQLTDALDYDTAVRHWVAIKATLDGALRP